jgi:CheY-like chemotaxis protein
MAEVLLEDVCDGMLHQFRHQADGQGITFSAAIEPGLPASVVTDAPRLGQVLKNLLSNAFKFTEAGEVALRFAPAADNAVAISVRDTGIGIKKEMQSSVFEAFAQADGTTARQYGGTGLGLSISRDLTGLLGGDITLDSEIGSGSTFTVYLPLGTPPGPAPAPAAAEPVAPMLAPAPVAANGNGTPTNYRTIPADSEFYDGAAAGTTVMVVDDEYRNIFALTALLERGGVDVVPAESGAAALARLDQRDDIDIVLMDIMMPVMDGYEAMTAIRERPGAENLPIIAVTGKVVGGERERCLAAGASDYIPKPVDTAELLTALQDWFPVKADAAPR